MTSLSPANISHPSHRIEFANALRGVAVLAVVLAHYCGVYWYSRPIVAQFTGMAVPGIATPKGVLLFNAAIAPLVSGPFGVALFFLISGFVIPFSFDGNTRRQFLVGRFFRLWPTYFCGFLIGILIASLVLASRHLPIPFTLRHIGFHAILGGREIINLPTMDGVIWTLETELRFYLVAAILGPALSQRRPLTYLAPALLLLFATLAILSNATVMGPHLAWARQEATYYPYVIYMFVGVSLNFYYRGAQSRAVTLLSIVLLLAAAALAMGAPDMARYLAPSYGTALLLFALAMAFPGAPWSARPLRFLARISFPLYAVHALSGFAILNLLLSLGLNPGLALAAAFAAALALAFLLHALVEAPTHRMGRRIAARYFPRQDGEALLHAPLESRSHVAKRRDAA